MPLHGSGDITRFIAFGIMTRSEYRSITVSRISPKESFLILTLEEPDVEGFSRLMTNMLKTIIP